MKMLVPSNEPVEFDQSDTYGQGVSSRSAIFLHDSSTYGGPPAGICFGVSEAENVVGAALGLECDPLLLERKFVYYQIDEGTAKKRLPRLFKETGVSTLAGYFRRSKCWFTIAEKEFWTGTAGIAGENAARWPKLCNGSMPPAHSAPRR